MPNYSMSLIVEPPCRLVAFHISKRVSISSIEGAISLNFFNISPTSPSSDIPAVALSRISWYVVCRPSQRNSTVVLKCLAISIPALRSGSRLLTLHPVSVWYGFSIAEASSLNVSFFSVRRKLTLSQNNSVRTSIKLLIAQIIVLILLYVNIITYLEILIHLDIDKQQYKFLNENRYIANWKYIRR